MTESALERTLKYLMKIHGDLSVSDLSRQAHVPQPTLHHILSGTTKKPRKQALEALASFFSVSVAQLTGSFPLSPQIPDLIKENLKITTVPLIEWGGLKDWIQPERKLLCSSTREIILDKKIGEDSFALLMKDTSMEPLFLENSILVFDSDKKPKDRDFALVYMAQDGLFMFNRLFIDGQDFFIKHEHPDGKIELIKLKNRQDKIVAILSEVRMQF